MHALIVVAHHHPRSLTHALAARIAEGVVRAGHSAETADLAAEGFEPRFGLADHAVHRGQASPPADVLAEQARIDRADTLVLVYPIYWWSMPALLKGWIDRVFSNGWAFDYSIGGDLRKKLQRLRVVLVGVGGARCRHLRAARLRRGDAHPDRPWHLRLLRRTGGPFRTVAGVGERRSDPAIWTRPCTSAASSSPHGGAQGAAQAQPLEA
ncbi:NAD(P)H dehydrogenase [Pseudomonas aeruginosa]|nr:NAD(P)H dehydrogenase [Pseudomonas aeruginosa]